MARRFLTLAFVAAAVAAAAQAPYKLPPKDVVDLVDAPAPPEVVVSPTGEAALLQEPESYPPIALLAEPILRLGGVRVSAATGSRQRTARYTGLVVLPTDGAAAIRVPLPPGSGLRLTAFSPDGRRFAFAHDLPDGVGLWVGDTATGAARPVTGVRLNDVVGDPVSWTGPGTLMARTVPAGRGPAPQPAAVPAGPVVEETAGKASQMATFQDLLRTPHDEALFEHYARAQLVLVDAATSAATPLGEPGLYSDVVA
jgi:dipeptidyl aminopeptidase/acylaminoacyl peptidase